MSGGAPLLKPTEGYSSEQFKASTADWTVFMVSTYILELDASKDFAHGECITRMSQPAVTSSRTDCQ